MAIEIQIDDSGKDLSQNPPCYGSSLHKTGAIYSVSSALQWANKVAAPDNNDGYWNEFVIIARGKNVQVKLNGKVVSSADVATVQPQGFIGLQFHTGRVQFRHFRIRELMH